MLQLPHPALQRLAEHGDVGNGVMNAAAFHQKPAL